MFLLINSHLQAYSLQVKSQDAVHTLGFQCVYISEILKPYHLPRRVKLAKYVTNWLKYILKNLKIVYWRLPFKKCRSRYHIIISGL